MTDRHNLVSERDELNSLVEQLNISHESALVFRAYNRYLKQLGVSVDIKDAAAYLAVAGEATQKLAEFFEVSFNPARKESVEQRLAAREQLGAELSSLIEKVDDSAARTYLAQQLEVMQASIRTNFYQQKPTLAIKLSPREISFAPQPRPLWEIWVYSPKVEGTHLRFGMVSRGGLRWSDRADDFRTEILGLVKAQRVKNSVIIPNGSKGGFFPKGLPDRDEEKEQYEQMGVAAYKLFIGSLLDLTDNLVDEEVVTPENVIALDGPDHYLVVAADKGTATFSDTANALSTGRDFWLGDAFASGGSIGFDHKEMGITARGAWESVKRHFASVQHDSQSEAFTMVGIGGMAGDVFGNGALLSEHIRLIAAFDSRHIFIDPTPDTASSYAERERLFNLPRAYWTDYNTNLISAGGGVFKRSAESIEVTEQMREALGIESDADSLSPQELIRAIVAAPVDLLYTGGTGTYVRASDETDAEVQDSTNDSMRITAAELRAKVVSEGGNLGLTQKARVEAARAGVLVNTDAVDNSAGVETSDHEVNFKILIDRLIAAGELSQHERNALIEAQVEEVGLQVLESNIHQNILLQAERMGIGSTQKLASEYIDFLAANGGLDREVEFLPTAEELDERAAAGQGLVSPELAVIAAYSKIWLTDRLLHSELVDDTAVEPVLQRYFPKPIAEKYGQHFWEHPLRREIVATRVSNDVIDTAGISFVYAVQKETGAGVEEVVRAFYAVGEELGMAEKVAAFRALDPKTDIDTWVSRAREINEAIYTSVLAKLS